MTPEGLILLKLGGSLITDKSKPFTERKDVIKRLSEEIHRARQKKRIRLIVGHGGGSYPHRPAKEYKTSDGLVYENSRKGLAEVQDAAARLNRIMVRALIDAGEDAMAVQPSAACTADNGKITEWYTRPIEMLLEKGMLPVVHGDIGMDTKKGCCILSTEDLFSHLTSKLGAKKVILCGKVDGVMTADPAKDPNARILEEITPRNFQDIRKHLAGSDSVDVTGGMIQKVEKALGLAKSGAEVLIMNGLVPGNLERALLGEKVKGTVIHA